MLVSWVESITTIGPINVTVEVSLAAFKQGYRVLAYQIVQSNAPIWLASGTIPEGKNIVVEELPTGSYEISDPYMLLCGQELTSEQLHALCKAYRPQMSAVQNTGKGSTR